MIYGMSKKLIMTALVRGMKPGTDGLRKRVTDLAQMLRHANLAKSVFNAVWGPRGFTGQSSFGRLTLIVGGDGRYHCREAIQISLRNAAAIGFSRVLVGQDGIALARAASYVETEPWSGSYGTANRKWRQQ